MMSINTTLTSGVLCNKLDRLAAVGGAHDFHVVIFQNRRQGKNIARVVVDHEHLAAVQNFVGRMQPFEHLLFSLRQLIDDPVQEQSGFVKQPLGGLDVL